MSDDNEPISVAQQVKRIGDAYASMYAPKEEEIEVKDEEKIETKSEEDTDATTT
jgi:hypothetical protein